MLRAKPGEELWVEVEGSWLKATAIVDQDQRLLVRLDEGPAVGSFAIVATSSVRPGRDERPEPAPTAVVVDVEGGSLFVSRREVVWAS